MRVLFYLAGAGLLATQASSAQWFDPAVALQVKPPAPIQFPNLLLPMQQIQAIEAAKAQAERDRAAARLMDQQTAAIQEQKRIQQSPSNSSIPAPAISDPIIDKWLIKAQPRMHLYSDFDKVVFSTDVTITKTMIELMAESEYAADIAYYLGNHKAESLAISRMSVVNAAMAISDIVYRLRSKE